MLCKIAKQGFEPSTAAFFQIKSMVSAAFRHVPMLEVLILRDNQLEGEQLLCANISD